MKLIASIAAVLLASTASAQSAPAAPQFTFALKGFVSMTGGYQTNTFAFSGGQQSIWAGNTKFTTDDSSTTFDIRQSRFNFSVKGPQVLFGATPSAVLEIDFYGGSSPGNFGNVSVYPRARTVYSELNWGAHRLQFGQQNDLVFAMAPTSLSHIGFPLGYGTGNIGWRRPGVFGYHDFKFDKIGVQAAWEIGRSQWADATPAANANLTAGEASGAPALEGRVMVNYGSLFSAFAAAHWQQADLYFGAGAPSATAVPTVETSAYAAGLKFVVPVDQFSLTLQGAGFTGENTGPLLGNFTNFSIGPVNNTDVSTFGYWAQLGVNLTKQFSLWGFYGAQESDEADVARSGGFGTAGRAWKNKTTNVQAIYRDGGYGLSAEWVNFKTSYASAATGTKLTSRETKGDQYLVTANYFF